MNKSVCMQGLWVLMLVLLDWGEKCMFLNFCDSSLTGKVAPYLRAQSPSRSHNGPRETLVQKMPKEEKEVKDFGGSTLLCIKEELSFLFPAPIVYKGLPSIFQISFCFFHFFITIYDLSGFSINILRVEGHSVLSPVILLCLN